MNHLEQIPTVKPSTLLSQDLKQQISKQFRKTCKINSNKFNSPYYQLKRIFQNPTANLDFILPSIGVQNFDQFFPSNISYSQNFLHLDIGLLNSDQHEDVKRFISSMKETITTLKLTDFADSNSNLNVEISSLFSELSKLESLELSINPENLFDHSFDSSSFIDLTHLTLHCRNNCSSEMVNKMKKKKKKF